MKKITYTLLTFLLIAIVGCNKEESITPLGGDDKYIPQPSETSWGSIIFDLYEDHGVSFIYDFDRTIYDWDMASNANKSHTLTYVQDESQLTDRLNFLTDEWLSAYPDDFIKEKFPYRVLMVDSIVQKSEVSMIPDAHFLSTAGLNYVAIARMGDAFETVDQQALLNSVNTSLLADYLFAKGFLTMPDAFFLVSGIDLYGAATGGSWGDTSVFYKNGFFPTYDHWGFLSSKFPSQDEDIHSFVEFYVSTPEDEVDTAIGLYPKMKEKYDILDAYLKSFGIGLH